MNKKRWEQEYPKMPSAFHLAVQEAVERQGNREKQGSAAEQKCAAEQESIVKPGNRKHGKRSRRFYLFAAAAVLLFGGITAIAGVAGKKVIFREELELENYENLEEAFQSDISVKVEEDVRLPKQAYTDKEYREWLTSWEKRENNLPLLDIREVMFDGMRLSVYAVPTQEGKKYSLEVLEMYINGVYKAPVDCFDNAGEQDYYIFTLDDVNGFTAEDDKNLQNLQMQTQDAILQTPFEVTLCVRAYASGKRYENQDLTFTVSTDAQLKPLADQEFVFSDYTVKVTELQRSMTSLKGKVSVEMTEEQKEAYEKGERKLCGLLFTNKDGTAWKRGLSVSEEEARQSHYNAGNLQWYFHKQIPEDAGDTVMLYLMAYEKTAEGEKFDFFDMGNCFGEGMEVKLKED
ncbi:MAG: hypothetical protein Q4C91_14475 [Eubacteriales bacterium]|nr:hypothetical protein [Eubacteriales bacterium]